MRLRGGRFHPLLLIGIGTTVLLLLVSFLLERREAARARRLPPSAESGSEHGPAAGLASGDIPIRRDAQPEPALPAPAVGTPEGFEVRPVRPMRSAVQAHFRERPGLGPWDRIEPHPPLGRYDGRRRTGPWTWFWEDGTPREFRRYARGVPQGESWARYHSGRLEFEGRLRDGRRDGEWQWWHETGNRKATEHYREGQLHGEVVVYYESGAERTRATFIDGEPDGELTIRHENGVAAEERFYIAGAPTGVWRRWNDRGELLVEVMTEPRSD